MSKYALLTGATGLVGRYLIRDLLLQGQPLALVVRPSRKQTCRERVETILQMWERDLGRELPRPVLLEGDVGQEQLGLSLANRRWVAHNCDRVIHNAAILTFHGPDRQGEPWRTNLDGTRNVLDFCRDLKLRNLHYVSTAYVCGDRTGTIQENELDLGQGFRNDYEHSKFLAEKLVREADYLDHLTVYRPAVIAGDAHTGYTSTYHGIYMYLKMMSVLVRNQPPDENGVRQVSMRLSLTGDELRNVVPVDWVSAAICHLFNTPAALGGTYQLAPTEPITPREIIDAACKYFNSTNVEFYGYRRPDPETMNDFEKACYASMTIYESYDMTDPRFDRTNLLKFTEHLPCPRIDETMLHRFLRFGDEDRWGKRREPVPSVNFWCDDYLRRTISQQSGRAVPTKSTDPLILGLEIVGPGGGQWTLYLQNNRAPVLEPGLPDNAGIQLTLGVDAAAALARGSVAEPTPFFRQHIQSGSARVASDLVKWLLLLLFPASAGVTAVLGNVESPILPAASEVAANDR